MTTNTILLTKVIMYINTIFIKFIIILLLMNYFLEFYKII
jgi:hypothetical protein